MSYVYILFLALISLSLSSPSCKENQNLCLKCNIITNLCTECQYKFLNPDSEGGCEASKKCTLGKNYCNECLEDGNLCKECENGYYPDLIGGCSYSDNCEISYKGNCIKCKSDYLLIGNDFKICKYFGSDDFQNCKEIDYSIGLCSFCQEGYFLNSGDQKCTSVEHCAESSFGVCNLCEDNYILNKAKDICEEKKGDFLNCILTIDGNKCDECEEGFYLSEDNKCVQTNFCQKAVKGSSLCSECVPGYYLTSSSIYCTKEKNCQFGDPKTGLCNWCINDYYLDEYDKKCKSNLEVDELKHCKIANNGICSTCESSYYLGYDRQCSTSKNCVESENSLCIACFDGYHLGNDKKCTNVDKCINSRNDECYECEDGYYYDRVEKNCNQAADNLLNCKFNSMDEPKNCALCKDDFYLSLADHLCHSNKEEGPFYKCERTNYNGDKCQGCVGEYYLGRDDAKCNLIQGCLRSESENKCLECGDYYCLDKNGNCVDNYEITDEKNIFYYNCKVVNEEGNGCAECEEGLNATDVGICYDDIHCESKDRGICTKCQKENPSGYFSFCLNKDLGCVDTFLKNCVRCDNVLELDWCTECEEGYEIDEIGDCVLKK